MSGGGALLLDALARWAEERPLERKLVVAPTAGGARELLRRLALERSGWVGFEVTTPRPLALSLAREALDAAVLRPLDAFEQRALLDEGLDAAVRAAGAEHLGELTEGVGFREAVHGAVTALRLAGVPPERVRAAQGSRRGRRLLLSRALRRYEELLRERGRADTATILVLALETLERAPDALGSVLGADSAALLPGLGCHGLVGRLLEGLRARGAKVLEADPVAGLEPPAGLLWRGGAPRGAGTFLHAPGETGAEAHKMRLEMFRAGSINEELREVLRRAVRSRCRWDEVEIVATDPVTYASALHALSVRLGVPVTYAVGLPVERTRVGRVVEAYLDWIAGGFQADLIRRLLEAGDLRPRRRRPFRAPADLARRFRSLRIGWGRRRYRIQIRQAVAALDGARARKWESPESFERRIARARGELQALRSILFPALRETPSVPDRAGQGGVPVSPAELARGLSAFLRRVPRGRGPDAAARDQIDRILQRVEATLGRRTEFEAALTILRRHLAIRVRTPEPDAGPDDAAAPWRSEGGHLHVSDLEHGGLSGRTTVFLVGVDAERVPGSGTQDPVLPDAERRVLGEGLPTSSDVLREGVFRFAALFARLRGNVTLSYGAWDAVEARSVAPSPVLLQALRLRERDSSLTFENLHRELGSVASPVPEAGSPPLDGDDVWMSALGNGGVLRHGTAAVRSAFTRLDTGLDAREERERGAAGPHHGVVVARPELDPRGNPELVVSASRLEGLGACPLRYLYADVARIRPPDDPELDPDRWLDPLRRGGLLHEVYEDTLRGARERAVEPKSAAFEAVALESLATRLRAVRDEVPSPGEGVVRREIAGLEEDVRSFVRMVRERGAPWVALEFRFGLGERPPVVLDVPGGTLRLRGAVDRVDEELDGLSVIDYKTGTARDHEAGKGTFNGGRRLQHAIYAEAVEHLLERAVVSGQYHFPTRRGQNEVHGYARARLVRLPELLAHMLDGVAAGAFVPTNDPNDCRFCDYAAVCRVESRGKGTPRSPLAEWTEERMAGLGMPPELTHLASVRRLER